MGVCLGLIAAIRSYAWHAYRYLIENTEPVGNFKCSRPFSAPPAVVSG